MDLVVIAEEDIESVIFRNTGRSAAAAAPLAETAGGVACLLKHRGDGRLSGSQRGSATIGAYRGVPAMFAGHQHATSGCAE